MTIKYVITYLLLDDQAKRALSSYLRVTKKYSFGCDCILCVCGGGGNSIEA